MTMGNRRFMARQSTVWSNYCYDVEGIEFTINVWFKLGSGFSVNFFPSKSIQESFFCVTHQMDTQVS